MSHLYIRHTSKSSWLYVLGILALAVSIFAFFMVTHPADAISTVGFKAGNIMDDSVMSNKGTMSESKIQSFLKSKNDCNRPVSGSGVTVYSSTRAYTKGQIKVNGKYVPATWWWNIKGGATGHFVCMADDTFSGQTAAHVIYQAAQDYNINPQVLIVLLQKEQGLITDEWPNDHQYAAATGYDCPDTPSGCNNANGGFITQIRKAASLFHSVLGGGWSNYPAFTSPYIQYNPDTGCGGSKVYIANRATSALYRYTPYQPNSATLRAGWPSPGVSCGAYGNLNFYMYFTQWFGSTHYTIQGSIATYYNSGNVAATLGDPTENESRTANDGWKQCFENGCIVGSRDTGYWMVKGSIGKYYWSKKGPSSTLGLPTANEAQTSTGGWKQTYQNGYIIGTSTTGYWGLTGGMATSYAVSATAATLGYPVGDMSHNGDSQKQPFENGYLVGSSATKYWIVGGAIGTYYWKSGGGYGALGSPVGAITNIDSSISYQKYQNGYIVGQDSTGYWGIKGSIGASFKPSDVSMLGAPLGVETQTPKGGWWQKFANGYIYGAGSTGYWEAPNAVVDYWKSTDADHGFPGFPVGPAKNLTSDTWQQRFQSGIILGNTTNHYWTIKGSIESTYTSLGGYQSTLGLPVANEQLLSDNVWSQQYENGYIVGSYGKYFESSGAIRAYWLSLNKWNGKMGMPTSIVRSDSAGATWQYFTGGAIIVNPANGEAWESCGSIRSVWAELGYQSGSMGYPTGPEKHNTTTGVWSQTYEHGTIMTKSGKKYKVIHSD